MCSRPAVPCGGDTLFAGCSGGGTVPAVWPELGVGDRSIPTASADTMRTRVPTTNLLLFTLPSP